MFISFSVISDLWNYEGSGFWEKFKTIFKTVTLTN